jgi:hypothetical protein
MIEPAISAIMVDKSVICIQEGREIHSLLHIKHRKDANSEIE